MRRNPSLEICTRARHGQQQLSRHSHLLFVSEPFYVLSMCRGLIFFFVLFSRHHYCYLFIYSSPTREAPVSVVYAFIQRENIYLWCHQMGVCVRGGFFSFYYSSFENGKKKASPNRRAWVSSRGDLFLYLWALAPPRPAQRRQRVAFVSIKFASVGWSRGAGKLRKTRGRRTGSRRILSKGFASFGYRWFFFPRNLTPKFLATFQTTIIVPFFEIQTRVR